MLIRVECLEVERVRVRFGRAKKIPKVRCCNGKFLLGCVMFDVVVSQHFDLISPIVYCC